MVGEGGDYAAAIQGTEILFQVLHSDTQPLTDLDKLCAEGKDACWSNSGLFGSAMKLRSRGSGCLKGPGQEMGTEIQRYRGQCACHQGLVGHPGSLATQSILYIVK